MVMREVALRRLERAPARSRPRVAPHTRNRRSGCALQWCAAMRPRLCADGSSACRGLDGAARCWWPWPRWPRRRKLPVAPLAIRFQNVAGTGSTVGEGPGSSSAGACRSSSTGVELVESLRGRQVPLLLAYLVLNRDRPVGREELIGGAVARSRAPLPGRRAAHAALAAALGARGATSWSAATSSALALPEPAWIDLEAAAGELARASEALDRQRRRAPPGRWRRCRSTSPAAACCPGVQARGWSRTGATSPRSACRRSR